MRVNISIPEDLFAELKRRQIELGQPVSWQLRKAAEQWLEDQKKDG